MCHLPHRPGGARPAWCDRALVERVAALSAFDAMRGASDKAAAARAAAGLPVWGAAAPDAHHLRKGVTGDWRAHFGPTLSAEFDALFAREMAGSGLAYELGEGERLVAPPMLL